MKHDTPSPFHPPRERGTRRALVFAVLTHALLFALLFYGISWQSKPPAGVEAELWSSIPEIAPDATPLPEIADQVEPALPSPSPSQAEQAEIALQQAKRQLETQQQQAAQEKKAREAERKQQLAEQQKMLRAQQQAQELAKQQRQARLSALQGIAGHNPTDGLSRAGQDAGSGGRGSPGYVDKVRRHVKSHMAFNAESTDGNPQAVVAVQCAPDGSILNAHIVQASGNPAWDDAVLRAVQKSDPMPRDSNGRAPANFTLTYRLND